ncbi:MAG: transporter substrate-binding domain-containing protein [Comamonas sp.]
MRQMFSAIAAACLLTLGGAASAQEAESPTFDKIKNTGKVVLGVRESSAPMAYALGSMQKYVGYHVELCEKVLDKIAPKAQREYMALTAQNTLPLVQNGTVDIGCGPTTNNLARQKQVAFAVTTYVSEVRAAVRADSPVKSFKELDNQVLAASAGTTAVQLLRKYSRDHSTKFDVQLGKDHFESFLMLESGRAQAFVLDANLLAGVIANSKNPSGYKIVGEVLGAEPIALLFRHGDAPFKKAVDGAIVELMKNGEMAKLYDKWFIQPIPPKNASLNLPLSPMLKGLFESPNDKPLEAYQDKDGSGA